MIDSMALGAREGETTLFHSEGVLVTSERLVTGGRTWRLGDVEGVEACHRAPRVLPLLFSLGVSVVLGLPVLLSSMAASGEERKGAHELALAVLGTFIFGAIAGLVLMGDTYWLVVRTRQLEWRVFRSRDPRLISTLVSVVADAAAAARQRH